MISVYLLSILAGIGYYLNIDGIEKRHYRRSIKNNYKGGKPSGKNIYNNDQHDDVEREINIKARNRFDDSKDIKNTGVVPLYHNQFNTSVSTDDDWMESFKVDDAGQPNENTSGIELMTGQTVSEENFVHNNMVPFFGAKVTQNVDTSRTESLFSNLSGNRIEELNYAKHEVVNNNENIPNRNLVRPESKRFDSRYIPGRYRQGERPFEQTNVPPAWKQGVKRIMPRNVDELRAKSNPKQTYGGRVVKGQGIAKRGINGKFEHRHPDRYYENKNGERNFRTKGIATAQAHRSQEILKDTNRKYSTSYVGTSGRSDQTREKIMDKNSYVGDKRQTLSATGLRNPTDTTMQRHSDYGKSTTFLAPTQRESDTGYVGTIVSAIKKITVPITDAIKGTKKEELVENTRTGNLKGNQKLSVYDPSDVAKTTIKETNIHNDHSGILTGNEKGYVYDPSDVAKTTIKETSIHDTREGNIYDGKRGHIISAQDEAKTTIKETTVGISKTGTLSVQGPSRSIVYDPDDVARVTMKETTHVNDYAGIATDNKGAGYLTNPQEAPNTHRQFTSDISHTGGAGMDKGTGYLTNEHIAPNTHRQFTSDTPYTGTVSASAGNRAALDRTAALNAEITDLKESTLKGRAPTLSGAKVVSGKSNVNYEDRKKTLKGFRMESGKGPTSIRGPSSCTMTSIKKQYKSTADRIDGSLLNAYRENPYTHILN